MSKSLFCIGLMFCFGVSYGQNLSVTFSASGAANQIDSVMATNLATNRFIILPGNETLILGDISDIPPVNTLINEGIVFPNPFNGRTTISLSIPNPQSICLKVQNLVGQVMAESRVFVQPGDNQFVLSLSHPGIYLVTVTTGQGTQSYKVICSEATVGEDKIQYIGMMPSYGRNSSAFGLKDYKTRYALAYTLGDLVHYQCYGGIHTAVLTDSPAASKNYVVGFVMCTDPDGKNYATVKIGNQTWMAENLAYLPTVSPSLNGSNSSPFYYVYGYEGESISDAKERFNYTRYGALYNGVASKTACPPGWRLPTDDDWLVLEKFLGMTESDANIIGYRPSGDVGKKLKSTNGWSLQGDGMNSNGFNALPGGFRSTFGFFDSRTMTVNFWTSTPYGLNGVSAYSRTMGYADNGMTRNRLVCEWGYSVRCLK
ncbi:MAG: FISUMP domain-containing protein [Bacteroidales bacterium]